MKVMRAQALLSIILTATTFVGAIAPRIASAVENDLRSCLIDKFSSGISGLSDEERQLLVEAKGNLLKLPALSREESKARNALVLKTLKELPIERPSQRSARKGTLSREELQRLFDDVVSNKRIQMTLCGGQKNGGYRGSENGFCAVRAVAVHLMALQSGAINGNVKKIWVVGNLRSRGEDYVHHVATAVRLDDGAWYVVDPNLTTPLSLTEWHDRMRSWNQDGKMRLFVTPASKRVTPLDPEKFSRKDFEDPAKFTEFYIDFLDDLYKENTSRPGPWHRLRSEKQRARLIKSTIEWLGISGLVGGVGYFGIKNKEAQTKGSAPQ